MFDTLPQHSPPPTSCRPWRLVLRAHLHPRELTQSPERQDSASTAVPAEQGILWRGQAVWPFWLPKGHQIVLTPWQGIGRNLFYDLSYAVAFYVGGAAFWSLTCQRKMRKVINFYVSECGVVCSALCVLCPVSWGACGNAISLSASVAIYVF